MVPIMGNTYPVRDQLRAMGGRWDGARKVWLVPDDRADDARKLVEAAGPSVRRCGGVRLGPRTCKQCGCRINYGTYCGKCEFS